MFGDRKMKVIKPQGKAPTVVLFLFLVLIISYLLFHFNSIPTEYMIAYYSLIILVVGILITRIVSGGIRNRASKSIGIQNSISLGFIIEIAGYTITIVIFLSYLKVGLGTALAAGGFAGLVFGLASQNVLSNIFGGLLIFSARPFKMGDRITLSTWQYGLTVPSYPPKFWSNDYIIPGYTGIVKDINLIYTSLITDENIPLRVPNSIITQAAIFVQSASDKRIVRTKYEISKQIDPDVAISKISKDLGSLDFMASPPKVKVLETTLSTYIVVIEVLCEGQFEEPPRSEILKIVMKSVGELGNTMNKRPSRKKG